MGFHDLLELLATASAPVDLSTGAPLELPELGEALRVGVRALADETDLMRVLSSYTQMDGLDRFRDGVAQLMTEQCGRTVSRAEVLAVPGVQMALRYVLAWLADRGRRALYPTGLEFPGAVARRSALPPAVGSHLMADLGDGTWRPTLDVDTLTDWAGVGAVLLSWPHSPTGRDWTVDELGALGGAAASHGAVLVLDETYAPPFAPITLHEHPDVAESGVVRLFSMSKLGLAGERVGFAVGPPEVIAQLARQQRRFMIQPPKVGQVLTASLVRAARADPGLRSKLVSLYRDRWEAGRSAVAEVGAAGVRVSRWEGGLFLWLEWDGDPSDVEVAEQLLTRGIAVMPAAALWVAPHATGVPVPQGLRIGLGADPDAVATAVRAAAELAAQHRWPSRAGVSA